MTADELISSSTSLHCQSITQVLATSSSSWVQRTLAKSSRLAPSSTTSLPSENLTPLSGYDLEFSTSFDIYLTCDQENSPTKFQWGGGLAGIFNGEHSFHFEPSKTTPGGTTFAQQEQFTGAFSFVMGENLVANKIGMPEKTHAGWKKYNEDLKRWCEQS